MRTALISALVAAFVTLVIEYFAKPSLEVRKEAILEKHRVTRGIKTAFYRCSFQVGRLLVHVGDPEPLAVLKADVYKQLLVDAEDLRSRLMDPSTLYDLQHAALLGFSSYLQQLRVVVENGGHDEIEAKIVTDRVDPFCDLAADALAMRWWKVPERLRVKTRLEELRTGEGRDGLLSRVS